MKRPFTLSLFALSVLTVTLLLAVDAARAGDLFRSAPVPRSTDLTAVSPMAAKVATRERFVTVDGAAVADRFSVRARAVDLARDAQPVTLNLFDDVVIQADQQAMLLNPSGLVSWRGAVKDDPYGLAVLVIADGQISATVIASGAVYEVRPVGNGLHRIVAVDQAKFPDEHGSHQVSEGPRGNDPLPRPRAANPLPLPPAANARATTSVIDLYVVYTPEVLAAVTSIAAELQLHVDTANAAYANSGIPVQFRMVGSGRVTGYNDTATLDATLNQVSADTTVAAARDAVGADLVTMLVEGATDACGMAWIGANRLAWGFSVTVRSCATGNLSLPHEIGHNLNAQHDRYVVSGATSSTYNYGYVDTTARIRTVMAYNNRCADAGFSCTRVAYFSSPSLSYNGRVLGVAPGSSTSADNVQAITAYGPTVAALNGAVSTTTGVLPQTGWWYNADQSGRGFALEYSPTSGQIFLGGFLYAADGSDIWYVGTCTYANGVCSGNLTQYAGGPTLTSASNGGLATIGTASSYTLSFTTSTTGTLTWAGGSLAITRFPFAGTAPVSGAITGGSASYAPTSGWYYVPAESGSGWFVEAQANTSGGDQVFLLGYLYNAAGQATWYVTSGQMTLTSSSGVSFYSYSGTLYEQTGGMAMTDTVYRAPTAVDRGAVSVTFRSPTAPVITLPGGRRLTLQRFSF